MNNAGVLPPADVFYSPPMRGRLAPRGLPVAAGALLYGGLPSNPSLSEPSGDAGEGRDLPLRLAAGGDRSYRPHPNLPSANALDYVQKASAASLLLFGLVLLLVLLAVQPRHAFGLLTRGAKHHAGMK